MRQRWPRGGTSPVHFRCIGALELGGLELGGLELTRMSRNSALARALVLASLIAPASALAQVPQAGAAGAGSSGISGGPVGAANPSVLSDPSGIGNASRLPPLGTNSPAPPVTYGSVGSSSPRAVRTPYI